MRRLVVLIIAVICCFSLPVQGQYCSASSNNCNYEYISGVQVGTINNTGTGCGGYTDYTSMSTTMAIGGSYPITVTNGEPWDEDQCGIWVDWNQDFDFNDVNETIAVSDTPSVGIYTATITPPTGASAGDTRMRIRVLWNGTVLPCGTTEYGEVEDYTITVVSSAAGEIHVDINTPDNNDGSSWAKAYKYLQDALANANSAVKPVEIWVAEGTYYPDANTADPCGTGNREATFQLITGVALYGGYAGYGAIDPNVRDIQLYETILSGDINTPGDINDNSYHVVTGSGVDETAVLNGFTITGGNANCTWAWEHTFGGGMYNYKGSPTIGYCTFSENSAENNSGAMHNELRSNPRIYYCTFSGNTGHWSGAMQNRTQCVPTLTNCIFYGNTASESGAISNLDNSSPTLVGCLFSGNTAIHHGGAIRNISNSNPDIINCTFRANKAILQHGGGIYNYPGCSPTLVNCILWGNTDSGGMDESAQIYGGTPVIEFSCVQDMNLAAWDPGNIKSDPLFKDPNGSDGTAGTKDDNLRLSVGSPCIDDAKNAAVPADTDDIDNDGDTTESLPWDLDGRPRFADGDCNTTDIVDMGAYEFNWVYIGDFAGGCDVDLIDFSVFALTWLLEDGQPGYNTNCDISLPVDGIIDERDLNIFTDNWLEGL